MDPKDSNSDSSLGSMTAQFLSGTDDTSIQSEGATLSSISSATYDSDGWTTSHDGLRSAYMAAIIEYFTKATELSKNEAIDLFDKCMKKTSLESDRNVKHLQQAAPGVKREFSFSQISRATTNFSETNIVGRGGQATVYKGSLDGKTVAIKHFLVVDLAGMETEIRILSTLNHPNVISLIGICHDARCVVYEYMSGGSLQFRLSRKCDGPFRPFTWAQKQQIAQDIMSGVLSLHDSNVLHRDLKPSNVLLDDRCNAKIADLGVARLNVATGTGTDLIGTSGYKDPNFIDTQNIATSSDIYAVGLIILQLCADQPIVSKIHELFPRAAGVKRSSKQSLDKFKDVLAPDDGTLPEAEVIDLLKVGLHCAEVHPKERPTAPLLRQWLEKKSDLTSAALHSSVSRPDSAYPPNQTTNKGAQSIRIFSLKEIKEMTNNFSEDRILGKGAYDWVYKGTLKESESGLCAVKKLSFDKSAQGKEQLQDEIKILTNWANPSFVKLYGYCYEGGDLLLLVYEYLPHRDLYRYLYEGGQPGLSWKDRLSIARQLAVALSYLHHGQNLQNSEEYAIHAFLKSSSVLVDNNKNIKLIGFAFSKVFQQSGYEDPNLSSQGRKKDVIGYGKILVEILAGKWVEGISTSKDMDVSTFVDPKIRMEVDNAKGRDTVLQLAELACNCLNAETRNGPSMKEVVETLDRVIGFPQP